jgi:stage V sporulation protein R
MGLKEIQLEIEKYAREFGLDFFPVIFEVVDYEKMNQLAAYGGFPIRYPHWRFGMEYDQLSKGYRYGLQKIYEMVVNTNPCYAYLLNVNNETDQKLVVAHVYAHCDFFKNNEYFSHTNRKMIDEMANHAIRIRRYIDKYGLETVESFIDTCLSLENLIDIYSPYIQRRNPQEEQDDDGTRIQVKKLPAKKDYLRSYINPPEFLAQQEEKEKRKRKRKERFPLEPERDILLFLMEHADLKEWQRDVIGIIREEAYYFAPQAMTKIMNEGWATFWHSKIMTQKALRPSEVVNYAHHHSMTVSKRPLVINPYRLGFKLFLDIEERWNKGRFGKEWKECDDIEQKRRWDRKLGLGIKKIFEVRRIYNDVTFIDTFLTEDFCRENKLFSIGYSEYFKAYQIESREFKKIKQRLLQNLTNAGHPVITITDANFKKRNELLLSHLYEGVELDEFYTFETLKRLYSIWKRPVHLETVIDDKRVRISYNGHKLEKKNLNK